MNEAVDEDTRMLARVAKSQRPFMAIGIVLALAGAAYLTWAIARYSPFEDPRAHPGFDRPVAQLSFLFERYQSIVEHTDGETPAERRLLRGIARNMQFSAGIMVLLLRVFLGTLTLVFGLTIMTVVVERARLLAVIGRLRE